MCPQSTYGFVCCCSVRLRGDGLRVVRRRLPIVDRHLNIGCGKLSHDFQGFAAGGAVCDQRGHASAPVVPVFFGSRRKVRARRSRGRPEVVPDGARDDRIAVMIRRAFQRADPQLELVAVIVDKAQQRPDRYIDLVSHL